MRRRIGLGWLVVTWIAGYAIGACARSGEAPPVVRVPSLAAEANASPDVVDDEVPRAREPDAVRPDALWCEEMGLVRLNPCPNGGQPDGPLPEAMGLCCESGYADVLSCALTLIAARYCEDSLGIARASARLEEAAQKQGEPCRKRGFRDDLFRFGSIRRLCAERGFPATARDAAQACSVDDDSCPPEWRTERW